MFLRGLLVAWILARCFCFPAFGQRSIQCMVARLGSYAETWMADTLRCLMVRVERLEKQFVGSLEMFLQQVAVEDSPSG